MLARAIYGAAALALVAAFVAIRLEANDVLAYAVTLPGGLPLSIYEPGPLRDFGEPPPPERLPAVVLAHDFAANRSVMDRLARRIARAGYAVLAFDFRGHGRNRRPFERLLEGRDGLVEDVGAVVTYAREHPRLDGGRLAVAGHAMGAGAVMRHAAYESGVGAVIGLSGGVAPEGAYPLQNLLLLWAEGDPGALRLRLRELGARAAGLERLVLERTYGEPERGRAVRLSEVPGTDHLTILYSREAARRILDWLAATLGPGVHPVADPLDDAIGGWVALGLAGALVLLWGAPLALRPLAAGAPRAALGNPLAAASRLMAALAVAVVLLLPGAGVLGGGAAGLLPVVASRDAVAVLAVAGGAWWLLLVRAGEGARPSGSLARDLAVVSLLSSFGYLALGGALAPYLEIGPRAERAPWALALAVLMLPFFLCAERSLRGPGVAGTLLPIGARVLVLTLLGAGAFADLLPFVLVLALGGIAALLAVLELVAASLARRGFDPRVAALLQSLWLGAAAAGFPLEG